MPVDSQHPEYSASIEDWRKCRAAVEGERAVKQAGTRHLPPVGSSDEDYQAYKVRAHYYNASGRTVVGLAGAVLRKPPAIKFPDSGKTLIERLGSQGQHANLVAAEALEEVIALGRCGLLVDAPRVANGTPYASLYYAENIIDWEEKEVEGKDRKQLTEVRLLEKAQVRKTDDPYAWEERERVRVLRLEGQEGGSPTYVQYLYEKRQPRDQSAPAKKDTRKTSVKRSRGVTGYRNGDVILDVTKYPSPNDPLKNDWVLMPDFPVQPRMKGRGTIDYIPFVFVNPNTITASVERSPIDDLVNVNLAHYRNSADLEHGLHFTALPTAWVAGFDAKKSMLKIGSSTAWVSENINAKAGFLEFSGAGLSSIASAMTEKEKRMAVLGARLLESQQMDAEAAETVKLRHHGENSVLTRVVKSVNEAMTLVLTWAGRWAGFLTDEDASKGVVGFDLNTDFAVAGIDPAYLTTLMQLVQGGMISWDTWFYNLKRGEVVPDDRTQEEEESLIEAGGPVSPAGALEQEGAGLENAATRVDVRAKKVGVEKARVDVKAAKVGVEAGRVGVRQAREDLKSSVPMSKADLALKRRQAKAVPLKPTKRKK